MSRDCCWHRALNHHVAGDWGDVDQHDHRVNERALKNGSYIFSVYRSGEGIKFWIIAEADRSSTCVLRPAD